MQYKEKVYRYFILKERCSNYEVKFATCLSRTAAEEKGREFHADHFDIICDDEQYVEDWKKGEAPRYYHWSDSFCYMP